MKLKVMAAVLGGLMALAVAGNALAGYEGQPGNQSGGGGQHGNNGNGPSGYEGQPGGQGN